MKLGSWLIAALITLIAVLAFGSSWVGKLTIETLLGAFLGTLAGAAIIFAMQLRMEQTRFFQLLLQEIKEIFSSTTAWQELEDGWQRCEFRKAVGMAFWTNDPCGEDGNAHKTLHINEPDVDWEGVVYRVDSQFCVASKSLHEYANWYNLLLDGYQNDLLSDKHVKMLWRSLGDGLFVVDPEQASQSEGMKNWLEFFSFGKSAQAKNKPHMRVQRLLEDHPPLKKHFSSRRQAAKNRPKSQ